MIAKLRYDEIRSAHHYRAARYQPGHSFTGHFDCIGWYGKAHPPRSGGGHDGLRDGMFGCLIKRGGMEERLAAEQGLEFVGVDAGKLARSGQGRPDPRELFKAARGLTEARNVLRARQPL